MPHKRTLIDFDPVQELKKHNTPLIIAGRSKAHQKYLVNGTNFQQSLTNEIGKPNRLAQKKTTTMTPPLLLNSIHGRENTLSPSHNGAKVTESREGKRGPTLSKSWESINQTQRRKSFFPSAAKPRANTGPSVLMERRESRGKSSVAVGEQLKSAAEKHTEFAIGLPSTTLPLQRKSSNHWNSIKNNVNAKRVGKFERKRSASIPQGKYSMAAIVRARSLAMKWYGGNGKRTGRQKLSKSTKMLPTINDASKYSLCAVSCSPQFAEAIKLMERDVGETTAVARELQVLSLD